MYSIGEIQEKGWVLAREVMSLHRTVQVGRGSLHCRSLLHVKVADPSNRYPDLHE